jgi:hypothetical protein
MGYIIPVGMKQGLSSFPSFELTNTSMSSIPSSVNPHEYRSAHFRKKLLDKMFLMRDEYLILAILWGVPSVF